MRILPFLAGAALLAASLPPARAEDQALLDALVKKGILTPKEAQHIKADMVTEDQAATVQTQQNKIRLSDPVKEMDIYGELRLRYFFNEAEQVAGDDHAERNRFRYRMRLGDNIQISDNFMIGILVEANNSAHSANVTLGAGDSTAADAEVFNKGAVSTTSVEGVATKREVVGFDAKTGRAVYGNVVTGTKPTSVVSSVNFQDAIFFAQVYMKYQPFPWLTLLGGKMPNPFITSRMIWDPDIYPEGVAEQARFTLGPWGGSAGVQDADGKTVSPARDGLSVDLFANLAQFIYEDAWTNYFNDSTGAQTPQKNDLWMLGWQLGAKVNFNKSTFLQAAPTLYNYTGGGNIFAGYFNGDGPAVILNRKAEPELVTFNQEGTNDLLVFDLPVEFDWKWGGVPLRIFADYAHNFEAGHRASHAGHPDKGNEGDSYQVGGGIGQIKHGGDWELLGWWQHTEQYALDPNIVDDDIFDGRLNMEGFYLQATYAFTDSFAAIVQGSYGHRIDSQIGTAGSGALGEPAGLPLKEAEQVYLDLRLKF